MTPHAVAIREVLTRAQEQLRRAEAMVADLEALCVHLFEPPVANPIIHPAYRATSMGWHPGLGREEDHQMYVAERREPRWSRTCSLCGRVEHTTEVTETKTIRPRFS